GRSRRARRKTCTAGQGQTLLMNRSMPKLLNNPSAAGLEPTWGQGSGLAQIVPAVQTPAWVTPSKFSLGEGNGGSQQLTITNGSSTPVTYDLSHVSTVGTGPGSGVYPFNFWYFASANPA